MALDTTILHRGRGEVIGDIDEDSGLVGTNLVDEDRRLVAEEDVAGVRGGKVRVDEFKAPEF
jgi:hypothetical protein